MKKTKDTGFTLLELIVVILIVGILASLGLTNYQKTVEKSRGAEAKAIIGHIRELAYAYWLKYGTLIGMPQEAVNIGLLSDQIPSQCRSSYYFYYLRVINNANEIEITARRCFAAGTGKQPTGRQGDWIRLTTNFSTETDTWNIVGPY